MASVPSVAVPVSEIRQDARPGPVALPVALHAIAAGFVNAPSATPVSFSSPAHVALKEPLAEVAVCSETFQTKLVQVLGVGTSDEDVQAPRSELLPAAEGPVVELSRSNPVQPAVATAIDKTSRSVRFFMSDIQMEKHRERALPGTSQGARIIPSHLCGFRPARAAAVPPAISLSAPDCGICNQRMR
jgi:hypothetical protein